MDGFMKKLHVYHSPSSDRLVPSLFLHSPSPQAMDALRDTYNGLRQQLETLIVNSQVIEAMNKRETEHRVEEKRQWEEALGAKDAEIAELKRELASRPVIEPNVAEQLASKDQRIRELEQQLESSTEQLEQQLTEANAKIAELEEKVDEQHGAASQTRELTGDLQRHIELMTEILECITEVNGSTTTSSEDTVPLYTPPEVDSDHFNDAFDGPDVEGFFARSSESDPTHMDLFDLAWFLHADGNGGNDATNESSIRSHYPTVYPSSSDLSTTLSGVGSEPFAPPPSSADVIFVDDLSDRELMQIADCRICLNEIGPLTDKTQCTTCRTQWHTECINEWTATNPTCPMCRSNFPNSS